MATIILGQHPNALEVRLTEGDGAELVATLVDSTGVEADWGAAPTLEFTSGRTNDGEVVAFQAAVDGATASWALTKADVDTIVAASPRTAGRLETKARISSPDDGDVDGHVEYAGRVKWSDGWTAGDRSQRVTFTLPGGPPGPTGPAGPAGSVGAPGADGASAYEVAVANGFEGTESEWLASLVGPEGPPGSGGGGGGSDALTVANGGTVTLDNELNEGATLGYLVKAATTFVGEGGTGELEAGEYTLVRIAGGWRVYKAAGGAVLGAVPDTTPPTAVTDLMATGGDGSVSLSWSAATDAESSVSYRYRVWLTSSGASGAWTSTTGTTATVTGLAAGSYTAEVYSYSNGGSTVPDTATVTITAPAQWVTLMEDSFTRTTDGNLGGTLPDTTGTDAWVAYGTSPITLTGTLRQTAGTSGSGYMPHSKPAGVTKFRATLDLHVQAQNNSLSPKIDLELFTLPTINVAIGLGSGVCELQVRGQNPSQTTVTLAGPWAISPDSVIVVERDGMIVTFKNGATTLGTLDLNTARDIYANVGDPFATMITTEFMENSYLRSVKIEAFQ